jgi:hypothetical protein
MAAGAPIGLTSPFSGSTTSRLTTGSHSYQAPLYSCIVLSKPGTTAMAEMRYFSIPYWQALFGPIDAAPVSNALAQHVLNAHLLVCLAIFASRV